MPLFQQFETECLSVAHWAETIAVPEARRWLATQLPDLLTPDMIAHLPSFFDLTDQNIDQWIDARDAESDIYLIRETGTGSIIGLMFITPPFNNDIHLGIFFSNPRGGMGMQASYLQDWSCMSPKDWFSSAWGCWARKPRIWACVAKDRFSCRARVK